jgi:membrane protein required for colicin V production
MQTYDILMLAVLGGAILFGFLRGMAWQVASLASIVLSYFMALRFSESLAPWFGTQEPLNRFIAMLVLYLASSLVVWLCFRRVSDFINRLRLREFDRQVGALFGAAKGVFFCIAITFFAVTLAPGSRDAILQSRSGHYIALLLTRADPLIPREIHNVIDPYLNRLENELQPDASPAKAPAAAGRKGG